MDGLLWTTILLLPPAYGIRNIFVANFVFGANFVEEEMQKM